MTARGVLADLERQGFILTPRSEGKLAVSPSDRLTDVLRKTIRTNKRALVVALKQRRAPYLNDREELIIPCDAEPKYRWWAGGQSIRETLRELHAPKRVVARRCLSTTFPMVPKLPQEHWLRVH